MCIGNYEVATDHTCRVFDNRSAFYTQMGMEDAAIFGYRVCCAANHTSAFSVVTTFNSQKMDSDSLVRHVYLLLAGPITGQAIITELFVHTNLQIHVTSMSICRLLIF